MGPCSKRSEATNGPCAAIVGAELRVRTAIAPAASERGGLVGELIAFRAASTTSPGSFSARVRRRSGCGRRQLFIEQRPCRPRLRLLPASVSGDGQHQRLSDDALAFFRTPSATLDHAGGQLSPHVVAKFSPSDPGRSRSRGSSPPAAPKAVNAADRRACRAQPGRRRALALTGVAGREQRHRRRAMPSCAARRSHPRPNPRRVVIEVQIERAGIRDLLNGPDVTEYAAVGNAPRRHRRAWPRRADVLIARVRVKSAPMAVQVRQPPASDDWKSCCYGPSACRVLDRSRWGHRTDGDPVAIRRALWCIPAPHVVCPPAHNDAWNAAVSGSS